MRGCCGEGQNKKFRIHECRTFVLFLNLAYMVVAEWFHLLLFSRRMGLQEVLTAQRRRDLAVPLQPSNSLLCFDTFPECE